MSSSWKSESEEDGSSSPSVTRDNRASKCLISDCMSLVEKWSSNGGGDPGAIDDLLLPITKSAPSLEEPRALVGREGEEVSK